MLTSEDFNIETDLQVIQTHKPNDIEHSTPFLMGDLDYDSSDIVDRLKELQLEEYSETLPDTGDSTAPFLFVFGKYINSRLVYIKLKIKETDRKKVLCLSFHYAAWDMTFPFA